MTMRTCRRCGLEKADDDFATNQNYSNGIKKVYIRNECKECWSKRAAAYRDENRERLNASARQYYGEHKERRAVTARAWKQRNRGRLRGYARKYLAAARDEVLAAYGRMCACCRESAGEFLAVDHTNGGGNAHRREIGRAGGSFFVWMRAQGYPQDGYRLLCHNCNMSKGFYGYCPHDRDQQVGEGEMPFA